MKLFLLLLALPLYGQSWLAASQVSLASSAVADVASSRGGWEANPVLGHGRFGPRQATISLSITAAVILAEKPLLRWSPKSRKLLTWLNFAGAGVHGAAAGHNLGTPSRQTSAASITPASR